MRVRLTSIALFTLLSGSPLFAQQIGFPPFGSFQTGGLDGINLQNLNVNFSIPVVTSPGRGQTFQLPIVYNSLVWTRGGTAWIPAVDSTGNPTWGWKLNFPQGAAGYANTTTLQFKCYNPGPGWFWATKTHYTGFAYVDPGGTAHYFPNDVWVDDQCWYTTTGTLTGSASDASGYYMDSTDPTFIIVTRTHFKTLRKVIMKHAI